MKAGSDMLSSTMAAPIGAASGPPNHQAWPSF
jgi:hypothetical protein